MGAPETIIANLGPIVQENNVLLFIILILLFVIGYKLLQTVVRLGLIAILSGVFLVVLDMVGVGPAVTIQRFILFMVLGTGLFIFYSSLATALTIFDKLSSILSRTVRWAFKPHRRKQNQTIAESIRKQVTKLNERRNAEDQAETEESKEKTIVLDEVEDDDE